MNLTGLTEKYQYEISAQIKKNISKEPVTQTALEISKTASDCVSNIQKGIIGLHKTFPKLDRYSTASDYFGVTGAEKILERIDNQMSLTWLKTIEQDLECFPGVVLSCPLNAKNIQKSLTNLKEKGFGRLTITDKLFGNSGQDGTHTVGMVYHRGKYVILDSLSETYPEIKNYHKRLIDFLGLNPKDVVFSTKAQQGMNEYTCNNWAHANLDAVIDYLRTDGKNKELTPEILDKILPEDINKILEEQVVYTINKLRGRSLEEIIIEYYNKM